MVEAGDRAENRVAAVAAECRATIQAGWTRDGVVVVVVAMAERDIWTYPRLDRVGRQMQDARTTSDAIEDRQPEREASWPIQVRDSRDPTGRSGWQGDRISQAFCFLVPERP